MCLVFYCKVQSSPVHFIALFGCGRTTTSFLSVQSWLDQTETEKKLK